MHGRRQRMHEKRRTLSEERRDAEAASVELRRREEKRERSRREQEREGDAAARSEQLISRRRRAVVAGSPALAPAPASLLCVCVPRSLARSCCRLCAPCFPCLPACLLSRALARPAMRCPFSLSHPPSGTSTAGERTGNSHRRRR